MVGTSRGTIRAQASRRSRCELATTSLAELDIVLRRVRMIPGVANSETSLCLGTRRSTRPLPQVSSRGIALAPASFDG